MADLSLSCQCGQVRGVARHVTPKLGNRVVCCCRSCQRFADYLRSDGSILDKYGGTDIFQMPIGYIEITDGKEHIRCLKLTDRGPHRWYTKCCRTPIGNTMSAGFPFIGLIHNFIEDKGTLDDVVGKNPPYVQTQHAKQSIGSETPHSSFPIAMILKIVFKMLHWKLKGLNKPNAFFDYDGQPIAKPVNI